MRPIGFSTGSLALGNFHQALCDLRGSGTTAVELSALRFQEVEPLLNAIGELDLRQYRHISFHAPSNFDQEQEEWLVERLATVTDRGWPIVLHPDAIHDPRRWRSLGQLLLIENMDKRKPAGRTARELSIIFDALPAAGLCFDIAHARQVDPSMAEAYAILKIHAHRIQQVHISEVSTSSSHVRISRSAADDYREVTLAIPPDVPVVLETPVAPKDYPAELAMACAALNMPTKDPVEST